MKGYESSFYFNHFNIISEYSIFSIEDEGLFFSFLKYNIYMYSLFIKTIADRAGKVKPEAFKRISELTGISMIYVKERFVGKGFSVLFETDSHDDALRKKQALESAGIVSSVVDRAVLSSVNETIINAGWIEEHEDRIDFFDGAAKPVSVMRGDKVVCVMGIDKRRIDNMSIASIKNSEECEYIFCIPSRRCAVRINRYKLNYSGLKKASKYSKQENFKTLLELVRNLSESYVQDEDYNFSYTPGRETSLFEYAGLCCILSNEGMLSFNYPESLINKDYSPEEPSVYDFKYKIYSPGDIIKPKIGIARLNLPGHLLYPPVFLLFILAVSLKTGFLQLFIFSLPAASAYMVYMFLKMLKLLIFVEDIPSAKIESASIGLNEIRGTVLEKNSIPSPVSGLKCAYFKYTKLVRTEEDSKVKWEASEIGEYLPECIFIEQNGKRLEIETKGAVFNLHNRHEYSRKFNCYYQQDYNPDVKYIEENIPVAADIYAMGSIVMKDRAEELRAYMRTKKADFEFVGQFDEDGNRRIDLDEWENMKAAIEKEFADIEGKKDACELLKMIKTKDDGMLFISDISEKQISVRLKAFLFTDVLITAILITLFIKLLGR